MRRAQKAQSKTLTLTQDSVNTMLKKAADEAYKKGFEDGSWKSARLFFGLAVMMVHDKIGKLIRKSWGGKTREQRAFEICWDYWKDIENGMFTFNDVMWMLKEECDVELLD